MASYPWQSRRPAQFAGKRAKWIVDEIRNAFGNVTVVAPFALAVERMHPGTVIHHRPKGVLVECAEIGDQRHRHVLDAFFVECQRKMMMIDHVVTRFRT